LLGQRCDFGVQRRRWSPGRWPSRLVSVPADHPLLPASAGGQVGYAGADGLAEAAADHVPVTTVLDRAVAQLAAHHTILAAGRPRDTVLALVDVAIEGPFDDAVSGFQRYSNALGLVCLCRGRCRKKDGEQDRKVSRVHLARFRSRAPCGRVNGDSEGWAIQPHQKAILLRQYHRREAAGNGAKRLAGAAIVEERREGSVGEKIAGYPEGKYRNAHRRLLCLLSRNP